jgi:hypothetical protein
VKPLIATATALRIFDSGTYFQRLHRKCASRLSTTIPSIYLFSYRDL